MILCKMSANPTRLRVTRYVVRVKNRNSVDFIAVVKKNVPFLEHFFCNHLYQPSVFRNFF